jgi:hypothetical protein
MQVEETVRARAGLTRAALLVSADKVGAASISCVKIAHVANISTRAAWAWLAGRPTSPTTDRAIRSALGLPLKR